MIVEAAGAPYTPAAEDRILVVAPHPDDDVLACGGTLALSASAGAAARVAYLTDGSASHLGSPSVSRAALRDLREAEARTGLAALGIGFDRAHFLRGRDGALDAGDAALAGRLELLVRTFEPTVVLVPVAFDPHPDHIAAAALASRALAAAGARARRLQYAVWLRLRGETGGGAFEDAATNVVIVDTRSVLAQKRRAIAAHRSQFGRVVRDDPGGFRLPHALIVDACGDVERFLESSPRA